MFYCYKYYCVCNVVKTVFLRKYYVANNYVVKDLIQIKSNCFAYFGTKRKIHINNCRMYIDDYATT